MPALERARGIARSAGCTSGQHNLGLLLEMYGMESGGYLPTMRGNDNSVLAFANLGNGGVREILNAKYGYGAGLMGANGPGFECRLLAEGLASPGGLAAMMKCPADPRPNGPGSYWTYPTIIQNSGSIPTVSYTAGPCWQPESGNGSYVRGPNVPWGYEFSKGPMMKELWTRKTGAANELYIVHTGANADSLFVSRPYNAITGESGTWTEWHPDVLPGADASGLEVVDARSGVDFWAGTAYRFYCVDAPGYANPWLLMDMHVEVQDNPWHDGNLWHLRHDDAYTWAGAFNGPPWDAGDSRYVVNDQNAAHGF
jgi:hypothetical protein